MVRYLSKLRIDEVSAVDRGAGDGCRVVLFKRDGGRPNGSGNGYGGDDVYAAALHFLMNTPHGAAMVRRFFGPGGSNDAADVEHLAQLVAQVMRTHGSNSGDAESDTIRAGHHPRHDIIGDATSEKVFHMDRNTELQAIVKRDGGVIPLCKRICRQGAGGLSENELTALITEHAMQLYPDMSEAGAFTKLFTSPGGEPLRKAIMIAKGAQPVNDDDDDDNDTDDDSDDAARAYEELQRLAREQKKRQPLLKAEQAFERASRERPDLLARATRR
jgi:hypothetical protein